MEELDFVESDEEYHEMEGKDEEEEEECEIEDDDVYLGKKRRKNETAPKSNKKTKTATKATKVTSKKTTKVVAKKAVKKATKVASKKSIKKADIPVIENWDEYMTENPSLLEVQEMIEKLNSTNGSNEKQIILSQHPQCAKALLYVNHPFWKYGVSSENVEKLKPKLGQSFKKLGKSSSDIFHMLDMLKDGIVTGHAAISTVLWFINDNKRYKDLIYCFIDKNLKIRCNSLSINKVFPGLVPIFSVSLANKYTEKLAAKIDFENVPWYASRKFDGVRTIIYINDEGDIKFYSREGNEFVTLGVVERKLKPLGFKGVIFDCEACIMKPDGTDDFKRIVSEIKKISGEIKNPRMYVFDMVTLEEFHAAESERTFEERINVLCETLTDDLEPVLTVATQTVLRDEEHLTELANEAIENEWEGVMIKNGHASYEAKRTNNLLKVKKFEREEFKVKSVERGPFRVVKNGKEAEIVTMTNIIIDVRGYDVSVGSGFSLEERELYSKQPGKIMGKMVSIQYQEESTDKNGKPSLRFPTFKGLYDGKRDI